MKLRARTLYITPKIANNLFEMTVAFGGCKENWAILQEVTTYSLIL